MELWYQYGTKWHRWASYFTQPPNEDVFRLYRFAWGSSVGPDSSDMVGVETITYEEYLKKAKSVPGAKNLQGHYQRLTPEPIDVISAWGLDYFKATALKYISRAGHKEGESEAKDLRKAVDFLSYRINQLEGKKGWKLDA